MGCFALPIAFFFLPYYSTASYSISGFDQLKGMFGSFSAFANGFNLLLTLIGYPLIAAILLCIRDNIVFRTVAVSAGIVTSLNYLTLMVSAISQKLLGFGLILNLILYIAGTVLAVVQLITGMRPAAGKRTINGGNFSRQGQMMNPGQQPYGQQGINYQSGPQVPPTMQGQPGQPYGQ